MRNIFFIPIVVLFFSCNAIKIKEIEMDSTQDLIGKVKQIEINRFGYPIDNKDTTVSKTKSILFFDEKNRITKQIDYFQNFIDETDFIYKNNLLVNSISKSDNRIRKTEYKYDTKNNVIEYSQFNNDTLTFRKSSIYDNKNNPIEQTYFHPRSKRNTSVSKFTYDYKNRTAKIQSFDENNQPKNNYLITYFNKKGYIIKTETIYPNANKDFSNSSIEEYDKLGNLTRRTSLDEDGKPKEAVVYKNTYDEKGNIIMREDYLNEKLIEKKTYKITYR